MCSGIVLSDPGRSADRLPGLAVLLALADAERAVDQRRRAAGIPLETPNTRSAFTLLLVQGFSELIKRIAIISGDLQDTVSGGGHHAAAEAEAERLVQAAKEEAEQRART